MNLIKNFFCDCLVMKVVHRMLQFLKPPKQYLHILAYCGKVKNIIHIFSN